MEALVDFTLDQIGLEGSRGCTVQALFALLEAHLPLKLGPATFETLPQEVREWLWQLLLQREGEVDFCKVVDKPPEPEAAPVAAAAAANPPGSPTSPKAGDEQPKKKRRTNKAPRTPTHVLVPVPRAGIQDLELLDKSGLYLLASQSVRDASLGIFTEQLATSNFSDLQRLVTEIIGQKRRRGMLRTELSKMLHMEATKFHYIANLLESRGLIVCSPILHNNEGAKEGHNTVNTSILHLRRFAPHLRQGQIFKEVTDGQSGVYGISNDSNRQMKRICDRLAAAKDMTLVETDLKADLGFRSIDGHRAWRRLRSVLENSGFIDVFSGIIVERKRKANRSLVRLLRPFQPGYRRTEEDEDGEDDIQVVDSCAEIGFEWQVMRLVVQAGPEGIYKHKICRMLGTSLKRMSKRLEDIRQRFNILETDEQDYRLVVKKWWPPNSIIAHNAKILSPPKPPQGFTGAVLNTIQNTPTAAELHAVHLEAQRKFDASEDGNASPSGVEASQQPALELQLEDLPGGLVDEPSLAGILQAEPSPEPEEELGVLVPGEVPHKNDDMVVPEDLLEMQNVMVTKVGTTVVASTSTRENKFTSRAQNRLDKLINWIQEKKFVLRVDLLRDFQETKAAVDRKTIMRIVDRATLMGKVQLYCLTVPPQRNGYQVERIHVIVDATIPVEGNHKLIREIIRSNKDRLKNRDYTPGYRRGRDAPLVHKVERLKTSAAPKNRGDEENDDEAIEHPSQGTATALMWENGFIQARMVRARLLHDFICELIGLAGFSPAGMHNCIKEITREDLPEEIAPEGVKMPSQRANGPLYSFFDLTPSKELPKPERAKKEEDLLESLSSRHTGLFTYHAMMSAMPLDLYCQIVGTANSHPMVQDLIMKAPKIGMLTQQEQQAVIDVQAKRRLNGVLDILVRMKLLKTFLYSDNKFQSRSERSVFVAIPDVFFEEPKSVADEHSDEKGFNRLDFDLRAEEDLEAYWSRLEYACLKTGREMCEAQPGLQVPEFTTFKGWAKDRQMPVQKWLQLKNRIVANIEDFTWEECKKAAQDLDLDYERVHRIAQQIRCRESKQRTRKDPEYRLPALKQSGPRPVQPMTDNEKRKLAQLRYRQSKLEWKQQLPSKAKCTTVQRPWDPAEDNLRKRKRDEQLELEQGEEDEDDDFDDPFGRDATGMPRRLGSRSLLNKKFMWQPEEDRFLLQGYVKWHALMGFKERAFRSQQRPMKGVDFKERQGWRRMRELAVTTPLATTLKELSDLITSVYKRARDRGDADAWVEREAERMRKQKVAARRAKIRQRRKDEQAKKAGVRDDKADEEEKYQPAYGALAIPFPKLANGTMFEIKGPEDAAAHKRTAELIEIIIAGAPRRADDDNNPTRRIKDIKRKIAAGMFDVMPPARSLMYSDLRSTDEVLARGPNRGGFRTLEEQLQRMVSKGAQSRAKLLLEDEEAPTAAVAAAAELIKALLGANESQQQEPSPDSEVALVRRFTEKQISAAFAHLRRRNFVYHGGSRKRFNLAASFRNALQVQDLPADVFEEAALGAKAMESSDTGITVISREHQEIPGGLIAEVLGMSIADAVALNVPPPQEEDAPECAAGDVDNLLARSVKAVDWDISAELTQVTPAVPSGLHMNYEQPEPEIEPIFSPVETMRTEDAADAAWAACEAAADAEATCTADLLRDIHNHLDEALTDGPTVEELYSRFSEPRDAVEAALKLLLRHGLVCKVPGFSAWVYVVSRHSASFFNDPGSARPPPDPLDPMSQAPSRAASSSREATPIAEGCQPMDVDTPSGKPRATAPKGKSKKRPKDRGDQLLAPWLDHKGRLNIELWRQLVNRIISVVIGSPGIKEDDVIAEMSVLTPCSTKRLLNVLLRKELLMVQHCETKKSCPPGFLRAAPSGASMARHFFIDVRQGLSQVHLVHPF